jgi:putative addiction module CopG family antidote
MARHIDAADLPEDIATIAQAHVAAGHYATVEEVIRAGVEAIDRYHHKVETLRAALEEGERSGTFDGDPFESVREELGLTSR